MTLPIIAVREVRKRFGATEVLRGVSFAVDAGECVGLAGINGAGKTTLLKCMLDFGTPESGTIDLVLAEDIGRIVRRVKYGFKWHGQLLRPEEVIAQRFG